MGNPIGSDLTNSDWAGLFLNQLLKLFFYFDLKGNIQTLKKFDQMHYFVYFSWSCHVESKSILDSKPD